MTGAFGPAWREPIKQLLVELDAFDKAAPEKPEKPAKK